jgi:hypothetical protein
MAFRGAKSRTATKGAASVELPEGITLEYVESKLYPGREVKAFRPHTQSEWERFNFLIKTSYWR